MRAVSVVALVLVLSRSAAADGAPAPDEKLNEVPGTGDLMPLRFATSGDFYYLIASHERDDFHVGTLQLDISLELSRYVNVSAGLVYDGASEAFGVGSFTIDCGLVGRGPGFLLESKAIERSGIIFGKFDIPFGIAYLEYSPVDNRLITQPSAVRATHGGWSDVGEQLYLSSEHFNAIAFVVNGASAWQEIAPLQPDDAFGGRLGLLPFEPIELGVSAAAFDTDRELDGGFIGADLAARPGALDVRLEYIRRSSTHQDAGAALDAAYARALYRVGPAFATVRESAVLGPGGLTDRELSLGLGAEIFPRGEVRLVHERDLDHGLFFTYVELVGGTSFQPTGFRR